MPNPTYQLAPGLEIICMGPGRYQLRSDFVAVALSGDTATELAERVLPSLRRSMTSSEVCALMPDYRPESLLAQLDAFVDEGVLMESNRDAPIANGPFGALLEEMGMGAQASQIALTSCKVAIFGLEAHGAHVAQILAEAGVGHLVLVDPFPFQAPHHFLTPVKDPSATRGSREDAVARLVARTGATTTTARGEGLTRESVRSLSEGCRLILVCWDRGFHAAMHWANEAAQELGVPALFSELRATTSYAGPLFLPGRSACWMCYQMRTLACEQDFDLAMAYEEHLDRKREPSLGERPILPSLPLHLASTLALEALKFLLRLNQPTLVDKVIRFDGLLGESESHPVLVKPYCPTCSKKKPRESPNADALMREADQRGTPLPDLAPRLVSAHSGIVMHFAAAARDATEPSLPHVWRARLANHCFLSEVKDAHLACSGKGMTKTDAWASCLGEAVERYSAGCWDRNELVLARRSALEERSLHPAELVLYRPEQYVGREYAPYRDETSLRWVMGRSLVRGDPVWIPAIATFMEYQVHAPEEFLFPVTSNGLAAGPTLADAVLSASYEVIERDAFLACWLNRLPGTRYDAFSHPSADVKRLARAWERRGVELVLYRMPTDHPIAVFMAIAFQRGGYSGPHATVGLGANVDAATAARSAALEVGQVRPAFRERCRTQDGGRVRELAVEPSLVKSLEDHALLYAAPEMAYAFDFLNGGDAKWADVGPLNTGAALTVILDHFASVGQDVLYVNLTPRDLEQHRVYTARVVLPGFQPIWFGHGEERLGGQRLFEMPWRTGLRGESSRIEALNPLPHPIA